MAQIFISSSSFIKWVVLEQIKENGHSKNKTAAKFNIQTNQLRKWISKKP